jgi:hypothetical protein
VVAEVEELARRLAGDNPPAERQFFAMRAAQALLDLRRVQAARSAIFNRRLESGSRINAIQESISEWARLERYEIRALARRNKALQFL